MLRHTSNPERPMYRRRLVPIHTLLLLAMVVHVTGCSSWHTEPGLDSAALVQRHPSRVRLRLTSGDLVELSPARPSR